MLGRILTALCCVLLAAPCVAAGDPAAAHVQKCEEHLKSLYGATLDPEQRACVERRIRAAGGFDPGKPSDCEEPLHACAEFGALSCLAQVEQKYRIGEVASSLGLDLAADHEALRTCVRDNARRMSLTNAVTRCDNVLKIHCPGLDLLGEISDAMLRRCKGTLASSNGIDPAGNAERMHCLEQRIYDRYNLNGEVTDAAACKTLFLEGCAPAKAAPARDAAPHGANP